MRKVWAGSDNFSPGLSADEGVSSSLSEPRQQFLSIFREILDQHGYVHQGRITRESEKVFVIEEQEMPLALVQDLVRRAKSAGYRLKFF